MTGVSGAVISAVNEIIYSTTSNRLHGSHLR